MVKVCKSFGAIRSSDGGERRANDVKHGERRRARRTHLRRLLGGLRELERRLDLHEGALAGAGLESGAEEVLLEFDRLVLRLDVL